MISASQFAAVFALFASNIVMAQQPPPVDLEKVLVPITAKSVTGAYGTSWSSELWMTISDGRLPGLVAPLIGNCEPPCPDGGFVIGSGTSGIGFFHTPEGDPPGSLMYVQRDVAERVHFTSLLQERTFAANGDAGLQLPVVRERDTVSGVVHITNIPLPAAGRATLRVYSIDPELGGQVQVRFYYASPGDRLYADQVRPLTVHQHVFTYQMDSGSFDLPVRPAALEMSVPFPPPPQPVAANYGPQGIRVEITPLTQGLRLWAFVSVVDNITQRVTLRTPG